MLFISFFSTFIDHFPRAMSAHQFTVTSTCTYTNATVVIDVLVVVLHQNVGESGYAISSWSASAGYLASMLTRVA